MRYLIFTLVVIFGWAACAGSRAFSENTPQEQIRFGNGGGFTGEVTEYCVVNNGKLYKRAFEKIKKLNANKQEVDACFDKCTAIHFRELNLNTPGNTYAFIEHHVGGEVHQVVWNPHQPNLSTDLIDFHNLLLALVGEEPMTVAPPTEATTPSDELKKKETLQKLKPIKKKQSYNNSNSYLKQLKQPNPQKVKKSKM